MRVRLRAPGGQHTAELADDATVGDLKATVFDKTGVAPAVLTRIAARGPMR